MMSTPQGRTRTQIGQGPPGGEKQTVFSTSKKVTGSETRKETRSNLASRLRGVRKEEPCSLYLKNIYVDENDSDETIGNIVKDFAKNQHIRIMNIKVIRYKAVQDVVGCRIVIPLTQEKIACAAKCWPDNVTCRLWEPAKKWYEKLNSARNTEQYGSHRRRDQGYNLYDNDFTRNDNRGYYYDMGENWS